MSTPQIPQYQAPTAAQLQNSGMPAYIPLNPASLNSLAISTDITGYGLTDTMFANQNPQLNAAQLSLQGGTNLGAGYLNQNINNAQWMSGLQNWQAQQQSNLAYRGAQNAFGFAQNTRNAGPTVNKGLAQSNVGAAEMGGNYNPNAPGGANLQATYNALTAQASGQQPIDPIVQRQLMQAGLGSAATAFGTQSLGTGTAGEANVAANLGLNVQNYINSQRQYALSGLSGLQGLAQGVQGAGINQMNAGYGLFNAQQNALSGSQSMENASQQAFGGAQSSSQNAINSNMQLQALASSLFPRRQYGLSGASMAQLSAQNTINQNNYNQALYADQVSQNEFAANLGAQQAGLSASNTSSLLGTGASVAAAAAVAAFCGIARRVLGIRTRTWERFRHWLNYFAESDLRKFYRANVKTIAERLTQEQIAVLTPIFRTFSDQVGYVPCNA